MSDRKRTACIVVIIVYRVRKHHQDVNVLEICNLNCKILLVVT